MTRIRKAGVAAMVICSTPFIGLAKSQARINGVPDLQIVRIDHPLGGLDEQAVRGRFDAAIAQIVAAIEEGRAS
jgi:hypothetical protein